MTQAERHATTLQTLLALEQEKNERLRRRVNTLRRSRRVWRLKYRRDIANMQRQVMDAESVAAWWKRSAAGVSSKTGRRAPLSMVASHSESPGGRVPSAVESQVASNRRKGQVNAT